MSGGATGHADHLHTAVADQNTAIEAHLVTGREGDSHVLGDRIAIIGMNVLQKLGERGAAQCTGIERMGDGLDRRLGIVQRIVQLDVPLQQASRLQRESKPGLQIWLGHTVIQKVCKASFYLDP